MVLDSLSSSIQDSIEKLSGKYGTLSSEDIDPVIKEIQRSLLQSDVDVGIVQDLSSNIEDRAIDSEPPSGVSARDYVLRIVYEELTSIIGESTQIPLENQTILMAGLQGSGKTTTSVKMGWWFEKKGLKSSVIQTDTQRPGAHQQTKQLAEEAEIDFSIDEGSQDAVERLEEGLEETEDAEVTIVDTAGRHASEEKLIDEIKSLSDELKPDLTILVINAGVGQSAKKQARKFQDTIGVDGVVITKMDGTAKGGGALTAVNEADSSISFLGTGESVKDIERFEPDGFVSRLLGMGDLKQLSERVERAMFEMDDEDWSPEDALEGEFTLYDMKKQMEAMNNMGRMQEVIKRIPGSGIFSQIDDDIINTQEEMMTQFSIIMNSMTKEEMMSPSIIGENRKIRIARGSGTRTEDVENLLEQYGQMESMFGQIDGESDIKKMMSRFDMGGGEGGLGPF